MKKYTLLAATAILSMGTMAANAAGNYGNQGLISSHVNASNTETIHMDVKFVEPLSITEVEHLDFGTLVAPRSGNTVVMVGNANGSVDISGSAIQLFSSGTGSPHQGKLSVSGNLTNYSGGLWDLYFTNDSVTLTSGTGNDAKTCGKVTGFRAPYAGITSTDFASGYLYYYATFTVDPSITENNTFQGSCSGSNTVTLVYGPEI